MKGWTADGQEVELTRWQEEVVRDVLLGWAVGGRQVVLPAGGRGAGKTTILATLARYDQAWSTGETLAGDPRRRHDE